MARRKTADPEWIPTFLAALAETRMVTQAAAAAGITGNAAYYQRRAKLHIAKAWDAALAPKAPEVMAVAITEAPPLRKAGWRTCFLEALAETSNVAASAKRANVPVRTVHKLRRTDAEFANKWRAALLEGYDHLEMELLGYLRDPDPKRKMDVAAALRLLAAHRQTVERERALREDDDEQAVLDSIDRFLDDMIERRAANAATLAETEADDDVEQP